MDGRDCVCVCVCADLRRRLFGLLDFSAKSARLAGMTVQRLSTKMSRPLCGSWSSVAILGGRLPWNRCGSRRRRYEMSLDDFASELDTGRGLR